MKLFHYFGLYLNSLLSTSRRAACAPLLLALLATLFLLDGACADDELGNLGLGGPTPQAAVDVSEKSIEIRESELKSIEDNLLQKINGSRRQAQPLERDQSGSNREAVDTEQGTTTLRQASYAVSSSRRRSESGSNADNFDSQRPERGPSHSVPVEQGTTKVSADQRLAIAESQVTILSRELETSRRGLRSAEKRIEELSELVKGRARATQSSNNDFSFGNERESLRNIRTGHTVPLTEETDDFSDNYVPSTIRSHSSSVASIVSSKAAVRTGPSKGESMLFLLPAGSEVVIDRRSGEWYRVVTDSGARGWIYGQSLLFDSGISSSSAVRVKAVRSSFEPTHLRY